MLFGFHFRNHDNLFSPQGLVEKSEGDSAAVANGWMTGDNFLYVLGVYVLPAHNNEILAAADDVKFSPPLKTQIAGPIPAVTQRTVGQVIPFIVTGQHR